MPIALFLLTQLGLAVAWASRVEARHQTKIQRIENLEQKQRDHALQLDSIHKVDARLIRIEALLEHFFKNQETKR
jgi:hypothetical protein